MSKVLFHVLSCLLVSAGAAQGSSAQQLPSDGFITETVEPTGQRKWDPAAVWNGAENLDTIRLISRAGSIDSIRLFARSGPVRMRNESVDIAHADARGLWGRLPEAVFLKSRIPGDSVAASLSAHSLISWVQEHRSARPYLTRVAAELWRHGRSRRYELRMEVPE